MAKTKIYLISHTHWDREWYQTYQEYRVRLVRMMDDLIENLEKYPEYKCFHMDGQTIILEDYLQVRPENRKRIQKLIADGRILIGPWYVMPDEFLIAGESLVKNLQIGHEICEEYGIQPMKNGYVIDIFGHNSQMPQILNGFDIHSATLYRGIGDYEKDAFCWKSPDGSEVIAAKLDYERSYSNFYFAIRWPYEEGEFDKDDAIQRMKLLLEHSKKYAASENIIMMDGVDHACMEPMIPEMIQLFEEAIPDIELIHTTIEEYFEAMKGVELEEIEGALYHLGKRGLNNQVLKNVLSSMVHIKQKNDICEIKMTSYTEPLNVFTKIYAKQLKSFGRNDVSLEPRRIYIDEAWKYLISNHPHDSICGCSLSDVHRDNEYRYRQVEQMSDISTRDCLDVITRNIQIEGIHQNYMIIYNPSQKPIDGITVVTFVIDEKETRNYRFYNWKEELLDVQILAEKRVKYCNTNLNRIVQFDDKLELTVAVNLKIEAFGYTVVSCDQLENIYVAEHKTYGFEEFHYPKRLYGSMMTNYNQVDNGKLIVTVNESGTLNIFVKKTGKIYKDMVLFEDCGDEGDGWNYVKPMYDRRVYSAGRLVNYSVDSDGPFACVLSLEHEMILPKKCDVTLKVRGTELDSQMITTKILIIKDSEELQFRTVMNNSIENHRLRVCFPTEMETSCFYTKTPFDMQKWEIACEDAADFNETDTFVHPSQGITLIEDKNDTVAVYAKGLYEVEVIDNPSKTVALTLMRAFETETGTHEKGDIRMQKKLSFDYAVSFARQTLTEAWLNGEAYRLGTVTQHFEVNKKAKSLPASAAFVQIEAENKILSLIAEGTLKTSGESVPEKEAVFVRVMDVSGITESVRLGFSRSLKKVYEVNLKGDILKELAVNNRCVSVICKANKITTVAIEI